MNSARYSVTVDVETPTFSATFATLAPLRNIWKPASFFGEGFEETALATAKVFGIGTSVVTPVRWQYCRIASRNVSPNDCRRKSPTPETRRRAASVVGRPRASSASVADFRLQSFGETFLEAIQQYCQRTGVTTDVPMPKTFAVAKAVSSKPSPKKDAGFQMFRKGASVAKVAEKVGVSTSTVTEYLAEFIQLEKPASIFGWVPEDVCERVAAAAEMHGTARLKPVFLELNEEVSYEQIRIVFAFLALQGPR